MRSQGLAPFLTVFPSLKQGAGWEAGTPRLEPAPIWDPKCVQGEHFNCYATAPGLVFVYSFSPVLFTDLRQESKLPSTGSFPTLPTMSVMARTETGPKPQIPQPSFPMWVVEIQLFEPSLFTSSKGYISRKLESGAGARHHSRDVG